MLVMIILPEFVGERNIYFNKWAEVFVCPKMLSNFFLGVIVCFNNMGLAGVCAPGRHM